MGSISIDFFFYMREIIFDIGISHVEKLCFRKDFQKVELFLHCICEQHYFFFFLNLEKVELIILLKLWLAIIISSSDLFLV